MARPEWTPNDEQQKLLAEFDAAAKERARADAHYRQVLAKCHEADIPISHLAATAETTRKTIYRHLGRPMK